MTGLTHESRNALQRSKACLEMLAVEVEDRPEALDLVRRIQKAQEHLQRLYEEVREYAAPIVVKPQPCLVEELWREVWTDLEDAWRAKELRLREEVGDTNLTCIIDRFSMGQVFRNILENAIAVSPIGGEIIVHGYGGNVSGRPVIQISICDQGPGLTEEQQLKIFEPFFTTKAKGTGLGMAISQRIVQAHGGSISAGNGASKGAEISITLPEGAT